MDSVRCIGMDVHRDTISVAVLDESGRLVMQSILMTRASAILDFIHGVRGTLRVTFEEGTHSAWLFDLLVHRVAKLVVCNPRKNALMKSGSKSDTVRRLMQLNSPTESDEILSVPPVSLISVRPCSDVVFGKRNTGNVAQL